MMNWRARQFGIVMATAVALVVASTMLELGNNFKQALDSAAIENRLVAESILRELSVLSEDDAGLSLQDLARSQRVRLAMLDAQSAARSVVHVAIYDPRGRILAHTLESREGEEIEAVQLLPESRGMVWDVTELWLLWRHPSELATEWPLISEGESALAVIRVVSSSTFLLHGVEASFRRGIFSIVFLVAVASVAGALAGRSTSQRLRELEASIVALREGRRQDVLHESGWADFDRVAREVNRLGELFAAGDLGSEGSWLPGIEMFAEAILVVDGQGRLLLASDSCRERLTLTARPGESLASVLGPEHVLVRMSGRLLSGENRVLVAALDDVAGDDLAVGHGIGGRDGQSAAIIEIKGAREQAELSSRFQQSRAVAHLGKMAAGVAHEIRGPLQGLEFDLDQLDRSWDDPESGQQVLRELRHKIQRLEWVVGGFLTVARVRPLRLKPIHGIELLEAVRESLEADALMAGIALELESPEGDPRILGDWETLTRALENAVGNAIEASPSRSGRVRLRCSQRGDRVAFQVVDEGPGIPADVRERVFDLYFTTKPRGTGVGLSVVRQAFELHRGNVQIDSQEGAGTTLTLSLPAAPTL